jgi:phosphoribosylglycinamide formyltransferase 1
VRLAILASHEGTTLQAVIDACERGAIAARVALVISNNPDAGALRRARAARIPVLHLSGTTHPDAASLDRAICAALIEHQIDLVLLAGYMKKLGPATLATFAGRVLNTHPALLPRFGGRGLFGEHVHRAVLTAGESESGATIHLVDSEYDSGPVIAQGRVPVHAGDTVESLAARVQGAERALLVQVLGEIASGQRPLGGEPAVTPGGGRGR